LDKKKIKDVLLETVEENRSQEKKLGKIIYAPNISATHQDPHNLDDYVKQLRRWNVGYWQTIIRHGIWPSFFWLAMGAFLIELMFFTIFILSLPLILSLLILNGFDPVIIPVIDRAISAIDIFVGVFLLDYLVTVIIAIVERKPIILLVGLGFIFLRFIDAIIYFISIPEAILKKSDGTWTSPQRI
jgi:cellulose synthase/poly-beta-1,6-N-acetylglucosamine synthase-like glycosyltransferase